MVEKWLESTVRKNNTFKFFQWEERGPKLDEDSGKKDTVLLLGRERQLSMFASCGKDQWKIWRYPREDIREKDSQRKKEIS